MTDAAAVQDRLEAIAADLPPQLRTAARFVLKEPASIALYPLRELAGRAGVSPATLVRLAGQLGFASYKAFRDVMRDGLHSAAARYSSGARRLQERPRRGGAQSVWRAACDLHAAQLAELSQTIPGAAVEAAARRVAAARTVYVLGLRANHAAALYFHYVLRTFRRDAVLLAGGYGTLIDALDGIGPDDLLVAISYEPYARDAVRLVRHARRAGAQLLALTDGPWSPIAGDADQVFLVPTAGASFYQTMIPTLAVLEALVAFLVRNGGQPLVDKVEAEFRRREEFGVYWQDGEDG
ncbi:MurR/RpiR family transcriptional regulator [Stella sp.]|uniref:MurR/RpiR family transcriptional regulator n=1 Tax=Stella sp. TaxID=2912054 RepID=UPI0035B4B97B